MAKSGNSFKTIAQDEPWHPIGESILNGSHPVLVGLGLDVHGFYMRLVQLCCRLKRVSIPTVYLQDSILASELRVNSKSIGSLIDRSCKNGGVYSVPSPTQRGAYSVLVVVGLEDRITTVDWKDETPEYIKRVHKESTLKEGATPKTASCPSAFPEVFEVLRSIDAKHYRTCQPSPGFERDLTAQSSRLGKERVCGEVESLRTWLEGQFTTGKLRRDSNHNPQARLIRWLKKCQPGDNTHGHSSTVDEFGRKETPTGRMLRLAREEQAAECERAESA